MAYDFGRIEAKWQAYWDENSTFRAEIDPERPKYYVLDMFPYPSGDGLHVGHPEGYTATDIVARYKRMRGFNVLHPMGWDAFGLPAERYAIQTGVHPAKRTAQCITNFKRQLGTLGFSYDWSREIDTTSPQYYKWTQWIFLQLWDSWYDPEAQSARPIDTLKIPDDLRDEAEIAAYRDDHRLAYLQDAPVNWCPELRVVLANEEVAEHVEAGREVVRVPMTQWMLRITAYAERLLGDLEGLDWPSHVLGMQRNWIGRSEGAEIDFALAASQSDAKIRVFTTRPDTLFGATYMVLAPEHPLVEELMTDATRAEVSAYIESAARRSERDRQASGASAEKTGVFTGGYARHPLTGAEIPVWVSDYVLMGYGTGAIMAVPGHDERDHAFAKAMGLPIVRVIEGEGDIQDQAWLGGGKAVASEFLDGMEVDEAKSAMIEHLEREGLGTGKVTYKLRDWLFSRQRYWGEPFPLVHEENGRVRPVPEDQLPVRLPDMEDFQPSPSGEPPLAKAEAWRREVEGALRETNTMPQWAGSCWYYLRFADPSNEERPWSRAAEKYWLPVDLYIGGAEHAVLHLLYARFWHKVLFDLGHVSTPEPFQKLVNQGMVLGATHVTRDRRRGDDGKVVTFAPDDLDVIDASKDQFKSKSTGEDVVVQWDKMSKSRGNVVNPDTVIGEYGADTMRLYEMFMGPLEASAPWQPDGVVGCFKFLQRVHRLFFTGSDEDDGLREPRTLVEGEGTPRQRKLLHQTIRDVTERLDRMAFNTAISSLMVFVRDIEKSGETMGKDAAEQLCLLLAPFAPHLAEECWQALGGARTLAYEPWPAFDDEVLVEDSWTLVLMVAGKKRGQLELLSSVDAQDRDAITRAALESPDIAKRLAGKAPKKVIYVPGKLVNVVP